MKIFFIFVPYLMISNVKTLLNTLAVCTMITTLSCRANTSNKMVPASLYEIQINDINGNPINLSDFKGKKILFVNVASECGFTSQYSALQKLHENHGEEVVVIGLPCNQFGGQEPGTHSEIVEFCTSNYGVTFLMTEKIEVKGQNQHPLYSWLTERAYNKVESTAVRWNFQKYLVDEEGNYIDVFYSTTSPLSDKIIEKLGVLEP